MASICAPTSGHLDRLASDDPAHTSVVKMVDYAKPLEERGQVLDKYHIVGSHGGAWIYEVDSNDELEMLLAQLPVYNFAPFEVLPLADMTSLPLQPSPE